jgi:small subunit ribosomal protein S8
MSKTTSDPLADMLSRIRNAIAVHQTSVRLPHSNIKEQVAKLLVTNQLIEDVSVEKSVEGKKQLVLLINMVGTNPRINEIKRISTPGRRLYSRADKIPTIKNGRGLIVVSTSSGLMTDRQARQKGIGGELICMVY